MASMACLQVNLDFDEDDDSRVLLLVHDTKPPFLKGKAVLSKQADIVMPLKDATSDMAVVARYAVVVHVLGQLL